MTDDELDIVTVVRDGAVEIHSTDETKISINKMIFNNWKAVWEAVEPLWLKCNRCDLVDKSAYPFPIVDIEKMTLQEFCLINWGVQKEIEIMLMHLGLNPEQIHAHILSLIAIDKKRINTVSIQAWIEYVISPHNNPYPYPFR